MRKGERFIVISGLSGSGKSTAIKIFEDLGFYCVDNLPTALLPKFIELCRYSGKGLRHVAMGVDIRERSFLKDFPVVFRKLRQELPIELLFFVSSKKVLLRRYSETRRRHPLAKEGLLSQGVEEEMKTMRPIRDLADRIIDTSEITVHDLKKMLSAAYRPDGGTQRLTVAITSFGYKHGLPFDADIVLDVRFLPNPHFIRQLRTLTGKSKKVRQYILSFSETNRFLDKVENLLIYLIPLYTAEGKSYLHIGLGCTGGRHRSVAMAEELKERLSRFDFRVQTSHRDIAKED